MAKDTGGTKTARGKIVRFLADKLTEIEVKPGAPCLITSPREISMHTGIDEKVVRGCLSRMEGRLANGGMVIIKVGSTDVVIKLAGRQVR